jgi:ATP-dependent exoDNAse (exonuclease V) alpha subunit
MELVPAAAATHHFAVRLAVMPLTPAYAFTVHKVQGTTLDCPVVLDLRHMWLCDHLVYVAASRVRRLSQLHIVNFEPRHVTVSRRVVAFTETLRPALEVVAAAERAVREPPYEVAAWARGAAAAAAKLTV